MGHQFLHDFATRYEARAESATPPVHYLVPTRAGAELFLRCVQKRFGFCYPAANDAAQIPAAKRVLYLLTLEKHFRRDVEPMTQTLDMFSIQFALAAQNLRNDAARAEHVR
jgi:hypothetical protein